MILNVLPLKASHGDINTATHLFYQIHKRWKFKINFGSGILQSGDFLDETLRKIMHNYMYFAQNVKNCKVLKPPYCLGKIQENLSGTLQLFRGFGGNSNIGFLSKIAAASGGLQSCAEKILTLQHCSQMILCYFSQYS